MVKQSTKSILLQIRDTLKKAFSVNGVLVTLFILILAALLSFIIQDKIQRQRYLELLELEIRNNELIAGNEIKEYNQKGVILVHTPYSISTFEAGLQSGYILTLDPNTLNSLYSLYVAIPKFNSVLDHANGIIQNYFTQYEKCIADSIIGTVSPSQCQNYKLAYDSIQKTYSGIMKNIDVILEKDLADTSLKFNPTQNRLKSPLLLFFMGNQRLKIQE